MIENHAGVSRLFVGHGGVGFKTYKEGVYHALCFLMHLNLANSKFLSKKHSNDRCSWVCYILSSVFLLKEKQKNYIILSAWVSSLFVLTGMAMREPDASDGQRVQTPTFSIFIYL